MFGPEAYEEMKKLYEDDESLSAGVLREEGAVSRGASSTNDFSIDSNEPVEHRQPDNEQPYNDPGMMSRMSASNWLDHATRDTAAAQVAVIGTLAEKPKAEVEALGSLLNSATMFLGAATKTPSKPAPQPQSSLPLPSSVVESPQQVKQKAAANVPTTIITKPDNLPAPNPAGAKTSMIYQKNVGWMLNPENKCLPSANEVSLELVGEPSIQFKDPARQNGTRVLNCRHCAACLRLSLPKNNNDPYIYFQKHKDENKRRHGDNCSFRRKVMGMDLDPEFRKKFLELTPKSSFP